jgi:hypothetical protein
MAILARCPECKKLTTVDVPPLCAVVVDMEEDKPSPFASEDFICERCSKPMHVIVTVELFED